MTQKKSKKIEEFACRASGVLRVGECQLKRQRRNARQRRSRARLEKFLEAKREAAAATGEMAIDSKVVAQ